MATGIGETLREAREQRGLSLEDAASETRIRASHLAALEREEFDRLGGDVYVRGFIRNYARAVGVDPEPLLADHQPSTPAQPVEQPAAPLGREPLDDAAPRRGWGIVAAGIALVAIVGLAVWGGGANDRVDMDDDPLADPDVAEEDDGDPTADDEEPAPDPTPTPADEPTPTDADERDERDEPGATAGAPRLALDVVERQVWLRVLVDGEEVFQDTLSPGSSETFDDDGEIRLRVGDAGAVELAIEGRSVGAPGADGQPAWVTVDADGDVTVE